MDKLIGDVLQPGESKSVIPADAGIHCLKDCRRRASAHARDEWIPAFAGMTVGLTCRMA